MKEVNEALERVSMRGGHVMADVKAELCGHVMADVKLKYALGKPRVGLGGAEEQILSLLTPSVITTVLRNGVSRVAFGLVGAL